MSPLLMVLLNLKFVIYFQFDFDCLIYFLIHLLCLGILLIRTYIHTIQLIFSIKFKDEKIRRFNNDLLVILIKTYVNRIFLQFLLLTNFIRQQFLDMYETVIKMWRLQSFKDRVQILRLEIFIIKCGIANICI